MFYLNSNSSCQSCNCGTNPCNTSGCNSCYSHGTMRIDQLPDLPKALQATDYLVVSQDKGTFRLSVGDISTLIRDNLVINGQNPGALDILGVTSASFGLGIDDTISITESDIRIASNNGDVNVYTKKPEGKLFTYNGLEVATVTDLPNLEDYVNTTSDQTVEGIKTFEDIRIRNSITRSPNVTVNLGNGTYPFNSVYAAFGRFTNGLYLGGQNKTSVINMLEDQGDGDMYLANDGTYKSPLGVNIVQTTGTSTEDVMSQKAVTDAISEAGGGDMLKSVYDTNEDGVVDDSEKLTGLTPLELPISSAVQTALNLKADTLALNNYIYNGTNAGSVSILNGNSNIVISGGNSELNASANLSLAGQTIAISGNSVNLNGLNVRVNGYPFISSQDGTSFLSDDGTYKSPTDLGYVYNGINSTSLDIFGTTTASFGVGIDDIIEITEDQINLKSNNGNILVSTRENNGKKFTYNGNEVATINNVPSISTTVTTNTNQSITGTKTFTNGLVVSNNITTTSTSANIGTDLNNFNDVYATNGRFKNLYIEGIEKGGIVSALVNNGDGTQFLANDGTYKTVSGGGTGPTVVQVTGTSTTDVMSQNAVTTQLNNKVTNGQNTANVDILGTTSALIGIGIDDAVTINEAQVLLTSNNGNVAINTKRDSGGMLLYNGSEVVTVNQIGQFITTSGNVAELSYTDAISVNAGNIASFTGNTNQSTNMSRIRLSSGVEFLAGDLLGSNSAPVMTVGSTNIAIKSNTEITVGTDFIIPIPLFLANGNYGINVNNGTYSWILLP